MKILLITSFFPPYHIAGTEIRSLNYAVKLKEAGYEIQVVCAGDWEIGQKYWNGYCDEIFQEIPVRRMHFNWALAPDPNCYLTENPVVLNLIGQWLDEWKPDIVHITSCLTLSASVILAAKAKKIPVVLTLTDFWFICPKINLLRWDNSHCKDQSTSWECLKCLMWKTKVYRGLSIVLPEKGCSRVLTWASKRPALTRNRGFRGMALNIDHRRARLSELIDSVDVLIAPTDNLRKSFKAHGIHKAIRLIQSGHNLSWLESMPPKVHTYQIRFAYIGQIIPIKGVDILVSAYLSAQLGDRATLDIYGDLDSCPDYAAKLRRLSNGQVDGLQYKGCFQHSRLGEIFSEIDVLILPSQWPENNPRVIHEAFASQIPVIASNVEGITEIVSHNKNGLLFQYDSPNKLSTLMKLVVSDPSIINSLRQGIGPVKTIGEEMKEIEEIYLEITEQSMDLCFIPDISA